MLVVCDSLKAGREIMLHVCLERRIAKLVTLIEHT